MVQKIASFLGKTLTDAELENIIHHTSKEQMKVNNEKTWRGFHTVKDEDGQILHQFIRTGSFLRIFKN